VYKAALIIASYLLGTFPTARVVVGRAIEGGSGNPGASNAYRTAGRRKGLLVLLGDAAKGAAATGAGYGVGGRPLAFACGAAAVAGHVLPVTRPRHGGKGVATAAGMAAVLFPALAAVNAAVWLAVAKATGKASVASLTAVAVLPVGLAVTGRPAWELIGTLAVGAVVVLRHTSNLRALARGEERSLR
jgi:acyl phosphate:glycerol-3-phosphate acyltransferase